MAAPTFFWVEETDKSIYKLFYSGHFEIQDGHHIGPNLVNTSPAGRDSKMISKCVCVAHIMFDLIWRGKSFRSSVNYMLPWLL